MPTPAKKLSSEDTARHRARIAQIEREARAASVERARVAQAERARQEEETRRLFPMPTPVVRREGRFAQGLRPDGSPAAIRVDLDGYVISKLAPDDLAVLESILRWTDARESASDRASVLDRIRVAVEEILRRNGRTL